MKIRHLPIFLFSALALAACAARPQVVVAPEPPVKELPVHVMMQNRAFEGVSALRSEVKVRLTRDGRKVASFKGALAYRPPDTMRLRMFTPFGTTAADLVRVVGRTEVYVPGKEQLFVGWTAQLIRSPLDAEYGSGVEQGHPVMNVTRSGELVARYFYDPSTGENTAVQTFSGGELTLEMRFSEYEGSHSEGIPERIPGRIEFDFGGLVIDMRLSSPEVVEELKDRLFHPFAKEGKEVLPLSSLFK